jgi:hypothetical protein
MTQHAQPAAQIRNMPQRIPAGLPFKILDYGARQGDTPESVFIKSGTLGIDLCFGPGVPLIWFSSSRILVKRKSHRKDGAPVFSIYRVPIVLPDRLPMTGLARFAKSTFASGLSIVAGLYLSTF